MVNEYSESKEGSAGDPYREPDLSSSIGWLFAGLSVLLYATAGCAYSGRRTGPESVQLDEDSRPEEIITYWSGRMEVSDRLQEGAIKVERAKEADIEGEVSKRSYRVKKAKELLQDPDVDWDRVRVSGDVDGDGKEERLRIDRYQKEVLSDRANIFLGERGDTPWKTSEHYVELEEAGIDLEEASSNPEEFVERTRERIDPAPEQVYERVRDDTYELEAALEFSSFRPHGRTEVLESFASPLVYDREKSRTYWLTTTHSLGPRPGKSAESHPIFEDALGGGRTVDDANYYYLDRKGERRLLEEVRRSRNLDIALLVSSTHPEIDVSSLGERVRPGDKAIIAGRGLKDGADYRTGKVMGLKEDVGGPESREGMVLDIGAFPGESGFPVYRVNDSGPSFIGVLTSADRVYESQEPDNVLKPGMSPKTEEIERFLEGAGLRVEEETGRILPPE